MSNTNYSNNMDQLLKDIAYWKDRFSKSKGKAYTDAKKHYDKLCLKRNNLLQQLLSKL